MKWNIATVLLLSFLTLACTPKKLSDKELANEHLQRAELFFEKNEINAAKLQIDSINEFYPNEVEVRKKAAVIFTQIELIEQQRNLSYALGVIGEKQHEFDSIVKYFYFEKNEKYQSSGNYIHKPQRYSVGQTCIKPYVEENGKLVISSTYTGKRAIEHYLTRFSTGDLFIETEKVIADGYNHRFKDGDLFFESVIYKNNNEAVASFMKENQSKNIKVSLQGDNRKHDYILTATEKKAMSETYNLSVVLSDLRNLKRIIDTSEKKIILYENNLKEN